MPEFVHTFAKKMENPCSPTGSNDPSALSVVNALQVLNVQCEVFKRSAEELGKPLFTPSNFCMRYHRNYSIYLLAFVGFFKDSNSFTRLAKVVRNQETRDSQTLLSTITILR